MANTRIKDRNWRDALYDRKQKAKILRHKLKYLICQDKKPNVAQDILIRNAIILILEIESIEQVFLNENKEINPRYLSITGHLRAIFKQLGVSKKKSKQDENESLDLTSII